MRWPARGKLTTRRSHPIIARMRRQVAAPRKSTLAALLVTLSAACLATTAGAFSGSDSVSRLSSIVRIDNNAASSPVTALHLSPSSGGNVHRANKRKVHRELLQRLENISTHITGSVNRGGPREISVPDHLVQEHGLAADASVKANESLNGNNNEKEKRKPLRSLLRTIIKATSLSLVVWHAASFFTPSRAVGAARTAAANARSPYESARFNAPGRYQLDRSNADRVVTASRRQRGAYGPQTAIIVSRGGARRGGKSTPVTAPPEPVSAADKIRTKILTLASTTKSLAESGIGKIKATDPQTKTVGGVVLATMVGVGIGAEIAGHRGNKGKEDGKAPMDKDKLSNTDKLNKEVMAQVDWYAEKYSKVSQTSSSDTSGDSNGEGGNGSGSVDTSDVSSSNNPSSTTAEIRKPDPKAQVRAMIENAHETERRARIERRTSAAGAGMPRNTAGVDYSQVKGLSTKEGEGKERVQRLVESTAEMVRRAEAQRLENARMRDMAEEREALSAQESLKNRIDSFISATEAEEMRHGFGTKPGDGGKALRAEVARLNSELDRARTKIFTLEAELKEKNAVEDMLRKEIDRLRRSG